MQHACRASNTKEESFLGSEIILLLKFVHDCCKHLLAIRRRPPVRPPEKFACPVMRDSLIRNCFDALSAGVTANCVLAELGVDQGDEVGQRSLATLGPQAVSLR